MTREEALKVLDTIPTIGEQVDALEMAIKALEQQPCEDCIDKKKLLKSIEVALNATNINDEYTIGLRNGMRVVKTFVDGKIPDYEKVSHLKKQEPCEDCISREAVENVIKHAEVNFTVNSAIDFTKHKREVHEIVDGIVDAQIKALRALPSVTPQPKIGRWIEVIDKIDRLGNKTWHHECSICGNEDSGWGEYKYCPKCGARMEVKE